MWRLGIGLVVMACLASCAKAPANNCTPGVSQACACPDGTTGAQACSDDGQRFLTCTCAAPKPAAAAPGAAAAVPGPAVAAGAAPVPTPVAPAVVAPAAVEPHLVYTALLTEQDHLTPDGLPIATAAEVLVQDREYVDTLGLFGTRNDREGDTKTRIYAEPFQRDKLLQLLHKTVWEPGVEQAVLTMTAKVQVTAYADRAEVKLLDAGRPLARKLDPRNSIIPIRLGGKIFGFRNGTAEVGTGALTMAEKVRYADYCETLPGPEMMVTLSYEGAERAGLVGTGSMLLVFGQRDDRLELLYSETFEAEHDQAEEAAPGYFSMEVSGFAYDANDATCCPSKRHKTRYHIGDVDGACKVRKGKAFYTPFVEKAP
jgi:hypothetical protein